MGLSLPSPSRASSSQRLDDSGAGTRRRAEETHEHTREAKRVRAIERLNAIKDEIHDESQIFENLNLDGGSADSHTKDDSERVRKNQRI